MSSFVLIEWLCIYSWPRPVRLMMGAKPCLRLIHYLRLIYLQLNITSWITVQTCHTALWTSLDQFTVCNFLFTKTHRKITVVMAELQVPFLSLVKLKKETKLPHLCDLTHKRNVCFPAEQWRNTCHKKIYPFFLPHKWHRNVLFLFIFYA